MIKAISLQGEVILEQRVISLPLPTHTNSLLVEFSKLQLGISCFLLGRRGHKSIFLNGHGGKVSSYVYTWCRWHHQEHERCDVKFDFT